MKLAVGETLYFQEIQRELFTLWQSRWDFQLGGNFGGIFYLQETKDDLSTYRKLRIVFLLREYLRGAFYYRKLGRAFLLS